MPRTINRLSARSVAAKGKAGYYADGAGVYLQVSVAGSKSWIFRYMLNGRAREMGLGAYPDITLERAREKAADARKLLDAGQDPIAARDAKRQAEAIEKAKLEATAKSFTWCAERYIKSRRAEWRNAKHAAQWTATLETYAYPVFGKLAVQFIDTDLVMKVIEPLWTEKTETATRLRGRIENVLDWAKVRGYRAGENPARWRGHLDKLLPKRSKIAKPVHHPALPYAEIGAFMEKLRKQGGIAPKALEFVILTAARVSEGVNARWDEINRAQKLWTVPGERMKAGKEHRVPLSDPTLKVLEGMRKLRQNDFVFPGWRVNAPITDAAVLKTLRDMGYNDITVHGFRSSFRDWAAEQTNFAREVAEAALAHTIKDKAEAAYRRADLLEKRRQLMDAWARYCAKPSVSATVTPIRGKKRR